MLPVTNTLIQQIAASNGVPWMLLKAVCIQESSLNPWAVRYEPHYRYLYGKNLSPTETVGQMTSFGVCQVMGAVAREHGFKGKYLTELCDPEIGLEYGARHLSKFYRLHGAWDRAISAYNQGGPRVNEQGQFQNQAYVDRVMSQWVRLEASQ